MSERRVYVDYMKRDDANRILLSTLGTQQDLERLGLTLAEGMKLSVYSDDADEDGVEIQLVAEGVVAYDRENGRWVLTVDDSTLRHQAAE